MHTVNIFNVIEVIVFILSTLLITIYLIPILFNHRFHNVNNIFTVNLCFAAILCCIFWFLYYIILKFYPQILSVGQTCLIFEYFAMMCTIQLPFAVVEVSVHRFCLIIYHIKPFFKKKRWAVICIACQWTLGIIFSFPRISFNEPPCTTQNWRKLYQLIMIVIIPLIICLVNNMIIFNYVRSSTNRIQTTETNQSQQHLSRRDLHLLRHMIVMFFIFLGGWSPIYIYASIVSFVDYCSNTVSALILLAELSMLFDIINLFLYNHELRRYLQEKIFKRN